MGRLFITVLAMALGLIGIALTSPAPAQAANVGTIFELELFKFFEPTGYANTCQGSGSASEFRAGSVLFISVPFPDKPPVARSLGSAQMQGSELTDHGTCIIRYIGSAPQGMSQFSMQAQDPFGAVGSDYTIIHSDKYGPGAIVTPLSRPDMPSISQKIYLDMFQLA